MHIYAVKDIKRRKIVHAFKKSVFCDNYCFEVNAVLLQPNELKLAAIASYTTRRKVVFINATVKTV